ncbi:MAG: CoA transferase [Acidimicrobiia bacterium]|nr:CoA transferase [Acidimicrobiia bacterium]
MTSSLLSGLTVVDLASVGPAARTSRWLADFGARVIKVGPPPQQSGVQIVPPFYAYGGHRGMERAQLDLKAAEGRDAFLKLASLADVVIESFRPGVVDRLGIGFTDVRAVKSDIVYCSTTGYGQTGPKSQWAGHDINYLAVGGYLDCSGRTALGGPALPGATVADSAAGGMHAVMSILAAVVHRQHTGEAQHLDVAVADGVIALMSLPIDEYLATGTVPGPGHNILTGRYACYDLYRCQDDRWVAVGAIEPRFYANLCRALGCEQWLDHQLDDAVQDEIRGAFAIAFAGRTMADWVEILAPADTCVSPVATVPELVEDEQYRARDTIITAHRPHDPAFEQVGFPLAGMAHDQAAPVIRDATLTDTDALLTEAGYDADAIAALIAQGVAA